MIFFNLAICCLALTHVSDGKNIQGILGRNVSFSWSLNNIKKDAFLINHGTSPFLRVWPAENHFVALGKKDRVHASFDELFDEGATLIVHLVNVTYNDAGIYTVARQWNSEEPINRINLQVIDQSQIPRVDIAQTDVSDYSLVLQCCPLNHSTDTILWRLNGSVLQDNDRYYPNDTFLSIRNLTTDDQYNLYTCEEPKSGFQSDPYRILISGPNVIMFSSNFTVVKEHEGLNVSCLSDCYPVCASTWIYFDPLMGQEKIMSETNILNIKDMTRRYAGTYSCRVQNIISGTALENFTNLDVVYGPDKIKLNVTSNIIQLQDRDSITILCSADCFPPCQIYWSEWITLFPGAELMLHNVTKDGNYTCHATNRNHDNAMISDTVNIVLTLGTGDHTTTLREEEKKSISDPTSKLLIVSIILGLGGILVGICCTCLLQKSKRCSRLDRTPNNIPLSSRTRDGENENPEAVNIYQGYWTIVSNAEGELSTALEGDLILRQEPSIIHVQQMNKQENATQLPNIGADTGENDYIHPIHSGPPNTDIELSHHESDM